jgi:Raf kinase inhibitor-like YbhB/YbcL family protein
MDFTERARRVVLIAFAMGAACSSGAGPPSGADDGGSSGQDEGGAGGARPGHGGSGGAAPSAADAAVDHGTAAGGATGGSGRDAMVAPEGGPPDVAADAGEDGSGAVLDGPAGPFALTSPVFKEGDDIATMYRCPPAPNLSPPLAWGAGPAGTQSYALTLARGATLHWVLWDVPATVTALPPDVAKEAAPPVPAGARQIAGGYFGPCPEGGRVDYDFVVYALKVAHLAGVTPQSSTKALATALAAETLARATLKVFGAK